MPMSRLSSDIIDSTHQYIVATAHALMEAGLIRRNSYGLEMLVASQPGGDFTGAAMHTFGCTKDVAEHGTPWYIDNAHGKNLICVATKMDSHEAVRLWQGLVRQIEGAFPWGGAVIDLHYGLIIGTSGFKEDEDILFSRAVRNFVVMHLDREGTGVLTDARDRGEQKGDAAADRFTRGIVLA
jgi:hypothetical protein